jgi:hypothetical protein
MTRSRLAAALAVPISRVTRWEIGGTTPSPSEVRALARELRLDPAEAAQWTEWCAGGPAPVTVAVEIIPPGDSMPSPDPFGGNENDVPAGEAGARRRSEVIAGRRQRRTERQARRRSGRTADDTRRGRRASAGAGEVFAPNLLAPSRAPATAVNTGAVFPVPATPRTVDRLTYSSAAPTYRTTAEDRTVYRSRWLRVALVLVALVALLWWAAAQLGDGWGALLDLFHSNDEPAEVVDALLWWFT